MTDAQGDQAHNNLELKNIFNLLNPNSDGEIEVKQINNLLSQLDSLKMHTKVAGNQSGSGENNESSPAVNQSNTNGDQKNDKKVTSNIQKGYNQKSNTDSIQKQQISQQSSTNKNQQSGGATAEKDFVEVLELRYFPNNKNTINFNEFCAYFNECMSNKQLQEELLYSCFNQFDSNEEAFINSKKIKSIFEVFNDKTNQEDIQNMLKFCGISNDKMSYDEFKSFFEKNI